MNTELGLTGRVAGAAVRHPWRTLAVWAVLLATAFVFAGRLGDVVTDQGTLAVATESQQAQDLISERMGGQSPLQEFIIIESFMPVDDPAFRAETARLVGEIRQVGTVLSAVSYLDGVPGLVAEDGRTALIVATIAGDDADAVDNVAPIVDLVDRADASGSFIVSIIGEGSVGGEFGHLAEETLRGGETIGLAVAVVILVLVFGAAVAAGIPLLVAMMSILLALAMTAVVGQFLDLSLFVTNMIVMIGLAVGIDYTLFIVQRYREERAKGLGVAEAVVRASDTATRAVLFSAITVVIGLSGLMIMPDTVMRSLGMGAILAVVATALAAVTVLPAMLRLLGDRINRGKVPFASGSHYRPGGGRFWHRVTRLVTARPILSVVLAVGILLAAATPYLTIRTGQNFIDSLPPDSPSRYAFEMLNENFDTGAVTIPIVIDGDAADPDVAAAVRELGAALALDPAYGEVTTSVAPGGDLIVLDAVGKLDPSTGEAAAALATLRTETIPAAFAGVDAGVFVAGQAAFTADYVEVLDGRSPIIFVLVLGASFLLLMMVFRSIVVPIKAILMNLLSVGAAYGLLVLVFQHGVGAGVLGFQQTDVIEAWVPLFLFTVLFGLSMDYHIFLLSRIKENYDETGDNRGSVAFGLGSTGAIITGAALIMVAVFGGFAIGDLVMFQQMGFGLAVAVILDATLVRSVLVPAAMALLGSLNWYLPTWLRWIPRINIEGGRHAGPAPRLEPALERAA
ncbi:MAG: MMPL family transporter [Actinobacteria bacterium]|nr:MMPL family transporter [Actinomycetota bacterium]